jgi:hypothetical protein
MAYNFPAWFQACPVNGTNPGADLRWKCYNRTGGWTVKNGLYMLDMSMSQAETTTMAWMDPASVWRNIVAQGTTATGTGTATSPLTYSGLYCIATGVFADDAEGEFVFAGVYDLLTVTSNAAQYMPKWTALNFATAQTYATIVPGSGGGAQRTLGRTLVAVDQGSTTVAAARSVQFYGLGGL